jgi:diguanylate cyclase (GGDEF)-like protein
VLHKLKDGESVQGDLVIDQDSKSFSLYVPLKEADSVQYAVRVFFSLADLSGTMAQVYGPAFLIGILLILINVVVGFILAHLIIGPIKIFNDAAKNISSGKLGLRVNIHTNDELEELADTFNYMAMELVKMRERAENANPLTKLPGNIVIHEEIEKRIKTGSKFTVIYCDLDNFKAFNDKYGIAKGDDAIKLTAEIFKDAVKNQGKSDDFIGHEGGDDFILLAKPNYAEAIAHYITSEFDKRVRSLYDKVDLDQGFIIAHARDGSIKQFPIMTISLAGVTNEHRTIASYAEVTNIAAEIKKKAKAQTRSCFVLDQRKKV